MSLANVSETMHAFIVGRLSHDDAVAKLGLAPSSPDAERLWVHRRAYVHTVEENAGITFPVTRRVVVARAGAEAWATLLAKLGTETERPMAEIRFGTAGLVAALEDASARELGIPAWVAELAALEIAERRVLIAPDVAAPEGELSVTEPLALLRQQYDVLSIRRAEDPTAMTPIARPSLLAVWRSTEGDRRTKPIHPLPLRVLHAVRVGGQRGLDELAADPALPGARVLDAARHLHDMELLRGPLRTS